MNVDLDDFAENFDQTVDKILMHFLPAITENDQGYDTLQKVKKKMKIFDTNNPKSSIYRWMLQRARGIDSQWKIDPDLVMQELLSDREILGLYEEIFELYKFSSIRGNYLN
jgi:hypothetical protein